MASTVALAVLLVSAAALQVHPATIAKGKSQNDDQDSAALQHSVKGGTGQDTPEPKLKTTVVVMNWKRPDTLKTKVLPGLSRCNSVHQIIVSHGLAETYFETPNLPKVKNMKHFKESDEFGMMRRFWAAKFSETDSILNHDDDQLIDCEGIGLLLNYWKDTPRVIHSSWGRGTERNGDGLKYVVSETNGEQLCVLSPMMFHKDVAAYAFEQRLNFESFVKAPGAMPNWICEDIPLMLSSAYRNFQNGAPEDKWFARAHLSIKREHVNIFDTNIDEDAVSMKPGYVDYRSRMLTKVAEFYSNKGLKLDRVVHRPQIAEAAPESAGVKK